MRDETKSKEQLMNELTSLRQRLDDSCSLEADLRKEITERQQAEAAWQASEERYKRLLSSVTDYIYTVSIQNGRPIATAHGPNCQAVTGYSWQEYETNPLLWYQMIHPDDRQMVLNQSAQIIAGGPATPLEHRLIHKDGSIRWVRNTPVVRKDETGQVIAYDGLITDITERKQLEEQLALLHQVGQELTRLRDEKAILKKVVEAIQTVLQCEGAGCGLINDTTRELQYHHYPDSPSLPGGSSAQSPSKKNHNNHHSHPVLNVSNGSQSGFCVPFWPDWSGRAKVFVPMVIGQRVIGVLYAISSLARPFSAKDRQLLQTLADQTATAIENARLYQEIQQRVEAERAAREQAEIMREATSSLVASVELNEVLDSILTHLERVVPYQNACIFLWDDDLLHAMAGRGPQVQQEVVGRHYPLMDGFLYQAIDIGGQPLFLINMLLGLGNGDSFPGRMVLPLRVRNRIIGYLTLDSENSAHYSQAETNLAEAFANKAAIAIQNARLFRKLRASHEQLQSLSRRLVELQESERRQIARELHDEAGQTLTGLMVGLRLLEREATNPEAVLARVADLERTTDTVLESIHRLAMNLRPAMLEHLGLVAALRQHIKSFNAIYRPTAKLEVIGLDDHSRLPLAIETNIYRIVQEALTNIVRHSEATYVDIVLKQDENHISIIVEDNGVGFNAGAIMKMGRLGILGMRERAEMLAGNLSVESTIGVGTTIFVEIPYDHSDSYR
ncbi:MAG: GAF domain-containing protein [Anaerolineaceae bacterium]|nr:GAF domain-containing protein [Anaerolineaceae bacterium]MCB9099043.1 GAF domain-containing protein [Anaerolineales bacterium]